MTAAKLLGMDKRGQEWKQGNRLVRDDGGSEYSGMVEVMEKCINSIF